jgi:hypothetical protein
MTAAAAKQPANTALHHTQHGSLTFFVDGATTATATTATATAATTPMSTTSSSTTVAAGVTAMHLDASSSSSTIQQQQQQQHQASVARILAQPESVRAEVEDTLGRLRERYQQLQRQLQQREDAHSAQLQDHEPHSTNTNTNTNTNGTTTTTTTTISTRTDENVKHVPDHQDDMSVSVASAASAASAADDLSNDEWIALSVLRGALPQGDSYSHQGSDSMDTMDEDHHNPSDNHAGDAAAAGDEGSRGSTEPSEGSLPKRARLD